MALILLALPLKAASIWLTEADLEATNGLFYVGSIHFLSIGSRWLLSHLELVFPNLEMTTELFTNIVIGLSLLQILAAQVLLYNPNKNLVNAVYCFTLLEYSTALYSLALFNPSLVFIIGIFSVPFVSLFFLGQPSKRSWLTFVLLTALVGYGSYLYFTFEEIWIEPLVTKYFYEAEVYGNFLFDFTFVLGLPILSCILAVL